MSSPKGKTGQPKALITLFLIEVFERASFYGMAAILGLYMEASVIEGGLGYGEQVAKMLVGLYMASVFFTPLIGGFLADRFLGARRTMLLGGVIIAVGHALVAFQNVPLFFSGLGLIAIGTGLLKPNINTLIGSLYAEDDEDNRNAGFAYVYMGINLGAMIAPLLCGFMAETQTFKGWLSACGFDPHHSWHWGFAAAGVGMCFGLLQYWLHRDRLAAFGNAPVRSTGKKDVQATPKAKLTPQEWHKLYALAFLFMAFALFNGVTEQAKSTLTFFAKNLTDLQFMGIGLKASFFQALNPLFVIGLTYWFNRHWQRRTEQGRHVTEPKKFGWGMNWVTLASGIMVVASLSAATSGKLVTPLFLVFVYLFQTMGELCISPVGNAAANRLAPAQYKSITMGVWYMAVGLGEIIAAALSMLGDTSNPMSITRLYGGLLVCSLLTSAVLFWRSRHIEGLMADGPAPTGGGHG